jgi:hypothetical protein
MEAGSARMYRLPAFSFWRAAELATRVGVG